MSTTYFLVSWVDHERRDQAAWSRTREYGTRTRKDAAIRLAEQVLPPGAEYVVTTVSRTVHLRRHTRAGGTAVTDIDTLAAVRDVHGRNLAPVEDVAETLGCSEDEARDRLEALVRSGHLAGPVLVAWKGEEWREAGYGLLPKGRDALTR